MDGVQIGASGLSAYGLWMGATANNLANLGTARQPGSAPVRPQSVVMQPAPAGNGVRGVAVAAGDPGGVPVYQPGSPLADASGTVRYPDIDVGAQMGSLVVAQRGYQLSLATIDRAREAYDAVLRLGKDQ